MKSVTSKAHTQHSNSFQAGYMSDDCKISRSQMMRESNFFTWARQKSEVEMTPEVWH